MQWVSSIGKGTLDITELIGGLFLTLARVLRSLVPPRFDTYELRRQLYIIGVRSIPIVILTAFVVGIIMVVQTATYVHKTGATGFAAAVGGVAVLSEIGPALIGIMFSGRVGANATAEFGTMVVSEQVDALKALAIDPMRFLVVPRFVAIVVSLVLLTVIGDVFGILGGMATSHFVLHIDWQSFVNALLESELLDELLVGLIKAATFGVVISVVSTTYGFGVKGGARGVGRAVNGCVVTTALGIFMLDYVITYLWFLWGG